RPRVAPASQPVGVELRVRVLAVAAQLREVVDPRQLGADPVLRRGELGAVVAGIARGAAARQRTGERGGGDGGGGEPLPRDDGGREQIEVVGGVEDHRLGRAGQAAPGELGGEAGDDGDGALDGGDPGGVDAGSAGARGGGGDLGAERGEAGTTAGDGAAAEQVGRLDAGGALVGRGAL